jgi:hypothetical protein
MDASHIVVAVLTGVSLALLAWVEIRSRRNSETQEYTMMPGASATEQNRVTGRSANCK